MTTDQNPGEILLALANEIHRKIRRIEKEIQEKIDDEDLDLRPEDIQVLNQFTKEINEKRKELDKIIEKVNNVS